MYWFRAFMNFKFTLDMLSYVLKFGSDIIEGVVADLFKGRSNTTHLMESLAAAKTDD